MDHGISFLRISRDNQQDIFRGDILKSQLVLVSQEASESAESLVARVQVLLSGLNKARVVVLVEDSASDEYILALQHDRVTVLTLKEFFETFKFEYLCIFRCQAQYFQIQLQDLFSQTEIPFPVYIHMPLNQRYLNVVQRHSTLTDSKISRLLRVPALHIHMQDCESYLQYIKTYFDASGRGFNKRVRAMFMYLAYVGAMVNESLMYDLPQSSSFQLAPLLQRLRIVAEDFFTLVKGSEQSFWDVVQEPFGSDFWNYSRAPWVACYAALMSAKSGQGDPMLTLMVGLLGDVSLINMEESAFRNFIKSEDLHIRSEVNGTFANLQASILERIQGRGLEVTPEEQRVYLSVRVCDREEEAASLKGLELAVEAQLLRLAEIIDKKSFEFLKDGDRSFRFLREKIWESEKARGEEFSSELLDKVSETLI